MQTASSGTPCSPPQAREGPFEGSKALPPHPTSTNPAAAPTHAGVYDERVFRALDWVVAGAVARGLRLLPCLVNYWPEYGGMGQYVRWSQEARGLPPSHPAPPEAFYEDATCQHLFRRFVRALLLRVNTCTGVAYRCARYAARLLLC